MSRAFRLALARALPFIETRLERLDEAELAELYRLLVKGSGLWDEVWAEEDGAEDGGPGSGYPLRRNLPVGIGVATVSVLPQPHAGPRPGLNPSSWPP